MKNKLKYKTLQKFFICTLFFYSLAFGSPFCDNCFSTLVHIYVKDNTIFASVVQFNEKIYSTKNNLSYYDKYIIDYLNNSEKWTGVGNPATANFSLNQTYLENAPLYFYYIEKGKRIPFSDLTGDNSCNPALTSQKFYVNVPVASKEGTSYNKIEVFYATCKLPKNLLNREFVKIEVEYRGSQTSKPSSNYYLIYNYEHSGLNNLVTILQNKEVFNPSDPICLSALILAGLLLTSMYFSGRSIFAYLDISVPRLPSLHPFDFPYLSVGTGNLKLSKATLETVKKADKVINQHIKVEFKDIENLLKSYILNSNSTNIQKYFALKALKENKNINKEEIDRILSTKSEILVREALSKENKPLYKIMEDKLNAEEMLKQLVTVTGNVPSIIRKPLVKLSKVPLVGDTAGFVLLSTGSVFFGGRIAARALKEIPLIVASPVAKKLLGNKYEELYSQKQSGERISSLKDSILYKLAERSDDRNVVLSHLFPFEDFVNHFYQTTRNAAYEEVVKNILWIEIYDQLKQKIGEEELKKMINSMFDTKKVLTSEEVHKFIINLKEVNLEKFYPILGDSSLSYRQKVVNLVKLVGEEKLPNELHNFIAKLDTIDSLQVHSYEKFYIIYEFLKNRYSINKPTDITHNISNREFFVTIGRDSFIYESETERKNTFFFNLAMKELINQIAFLKIRERPLENEDMFRTEHAFMLAWLKLKNLFMGYGNISFEENIITVYDPNEKKPTKINYVKNLLGLDEKEINKINDREQNYFFELLTKEGKKLLSDSKSLRYTPIDLLQNITYATERDIEQGKLINKSFVALLSEIQPEEKNWKVKMDFYWQPASSNQSALADHRNVSYLSSLPQKEEAWRGIEYRLDKRIADYLNSGHLEHFLTGERFNLIKSLTHPDIYKYFNETAHNIFGFYKGFQSLYKEKTGKEPINHEELFEFFRKPENKFVTYDMIRRGRTPLIFLNEMGYIPYSSSSLTVSDYDLPLRNNVLIYKKNINGREVEAVFNIKKMSQYEKELFSHPEAEELRNILKIVEMLKEIPSPNFIKEVKEKLQSIRAKNVGINEEELISLLNRLEEKLVALKGIKIESELFSEENLRGKRKISEVIGKYNEVEAIVEEIKNKIKSSNLTNEDKKILTIKLDYLNPHLLPRRALSEEELEHINTILMQSKASSEVKIAFLSHFGALTYDHSTLWKKSNIARIGTFEEARELLEKEALESGSKTAKVRNLLTNILSPVVSEFEKSVLRIFSRETRAMGAANAISEILRENYDRRFILIKSGEIFNNLDEETIKSLKPYYDEYADSLTKYFTAWAITVTRDPRGSSTQWGRQWYFAPLYHRGPAMHFFPYEFGFERTARDKWDWAFNRIWLMPLSISNWLIARSLLKPIRSAQTAMYGYPTLSDRKYISGRLDPLSPWPTVRYSTFQVFSSFLNPFEAMFSLKNWSLSKNIRYFINATPILNILSYIFPSLDVAEFTRDRQYSSNKYLNYLDRIGNKITNIVEKTPGINKIFSESYTQRSGRSGDKVLIGNRPMPEAFVAYKNVYGVNVEDANPGLSLVTYSGHYRLDPRIANYLIYSEIPLSKDKTIRDIFEINEAIKFYATSQVVRRSIAPEAKLLHNLREFSYYGPTDNPMWSLIFAPVTLYWMGKSGYGKIKSIYYNVRNIPNYVRGIYRREEQPPGYKPLAFTEKIKEKLLLKFSTDLFICPYCGSHVIRGRICTKCGRYI